MSNAMQSISFGSFQLKNNFVLAPMTRTSASRNGIPTTLMANHYAGYAKGGFALLITEGIFIDDKASQGYTNQPGIVNRHQIDGWREVVDSVHSSGSKIFAQLMHAGTQFQSNIYTDQPIGPSSVKPKGAPLTLYGDEKEWPSPVEMSEADIYKVTQSFVESAKNAREAGFDGIELHGANGYLLYQFLSPFFNRRTDSFGGSLESRLTFVIDIIREIRKAVGERYPLGIRLSQGTVTDPDYRLPEGEVGFRRIIEAVRDAGVDYVHTTDTDVGRQWFAQGEESLASVAAGVSDIDVIINGGISEVNYMSLASKYPRVLFSLGKKALANPDFVERLKEGKKIAEFDFSMLQPKATIENELSWRSKSK